MKDLPVPESAAMTANLMDAMLLLLLLLLLLLGPAAALLLVVSNVLFANHL